MVKGSSLCVLTPIYNVAIYSTFWLVSVTEQVGLPKDRFSCNETHMEKGSSSCVLIPIYWPASEMILLVPISILSIMLSVTLGVVITIMVLVIHKVVIVLQSMNENFHTDFQLFIQWSDKSWEQDFNIYGQASWWQVKSEEQSVTRKVLVIIWFGLTKILSVKL